MMLGKQIVRNWLHSVQYNIFFVHRKWII
jgi:hypothetical protein